MSAKIVISFDFELGWGVLDSPLWRRRQDAGVYEKLRPVINELTGYFEENSVRTTWASVGAMFEPGTGNIKTEHLPDEYRRDVESFLTNADKKTWNALDIVDMLKDKSSIEVASHTYSHIYASYPGTKLEHQLKDSRLSVDILQDVFQRQMKSIIYPRDQIDHRSEIYEALKLQYRINPSFFKKSGAVNRLLRGAKSFLVGVPQSDVYIGSKMECAQVGSLYFNWVGGRYESLKKLNLLLSINKLKKQVKKETGLYHIWLHPFNLTESSLVLEEFYKFIGELLELQKNYRVEFLSMEDIRASIKQ